MLGMASFVGIVDSAGICNSTL